MAGRHRRHGGETRRHKGPLDRVEVRFEGAGDVLWRVFRRRAYVGVTIAAGGAAALAALIGPGELAAAAMAGYMAYLVLRRHVPPSKAFEKAVGAARPANP